jgi:putative ABC transport system permease protein
MLLDLRAAFRSIARTPGFFIGAALTLALGLGAVTTAFGLLAGALGQAGAGSTDDRVVLYLTERVNGRDSRARWPYAGIRELRSSATSFANIASYTTGTLNLTGTGESARVEVEFVSPAYFAIVDASPRIGRTTAATEQDVAGGPAEIVIGYALWQRLFAGSPSAIGQTLRLAREPLTVVGVMPEGFRGLSGRGEAWVPHTMAPVLDFAGYFTSDEYFQNVIATLKPDVSVDQARSELQVIGSRVAALVPPRSDNAIDRGATAVPLAEAQTNAADVRARLYVAVGAVLVLLIAGINLANLVSTRVRARQREFSVRVAMGAGRRHVFRSVGAEMVLVAAAGFMLAMVLAAWTRDLVMLIIPAGLASPANDYGQLASFASLEIDGLVTATVAALALATIAAASFLATRPSLRGDLTATLKSGGDRSSTRGPGGGERLLLSMQVAASISLVASAGLVLRSVSALDSVHPGFDATRVVAFSVEEDLAAQQPDAGPAMVDRLLTGLAGVRGVEAITVGQCTPFGSRCARQQVVIEDRPETETTPPVMGWHRVGPGHFAALGIPVVRGRDFTTADRRGRTPVVVINQAAARLHFANQDPIGRRIRVPQVVPGDPDMAEIVGIVGDVIYWPLDEAPRADVYQPALQFALSFTTVMVRVAPASWRDGFPFGPSRQPIFESLRQAMVNLDPNLPMFNAVVLNDLARAGRADRRFVSLLLSSCAVLALLLAAVGIYSLTASWFQSRRKELGVRVALGASPAGLVRSLMAGALLQTALGVVAGIALAAGFGQLLRGLLFGIGPNDPTALTFSAIVMLGVASVAAWLPARRALRLDPVEQLRAD